MSNTDLWRLVEKTPPEQTKEITGKPYRGTSPKPYWLVQRATEVFGPCGIGWGFTILSDRVEQGGRDGDRVHIAHIRLWFMWGDKRGEVEHVGQTMFSGTNKNGLYTDEDAPKKSVTDALVKALSMVGFAGDIFMGRYDDSKYVNELRQEAAQHAPAPAKPTPVKSSRHSEVEAELVRSAQKGSKVLRAAWESLSKEDRTHFQAAKDRRFKPIADAVDRGLAIEDAA